MIDVVRDLEGVRMALEEIFEQGYVRSRIAQQLDGADEATRARMEERVPPRTLSPGYYTFAEHLLALEAKHNAGITYSLGDLADFELDGLREIGRARDGHSGRHPACSACGANQQNRFPVQCHACGAKFQRGGK